MLFMIPFFVDWTFSQNRYAERRFYGHYTNVRLADSGLFKKIDHLINCHGCWGLHAGSAGGRRSRLGGGLLRRWKATAIL